MKKKARKPKSRPSSPSVVHLSFGYKKNFSCRKVKVVICNRKPYGRGYDLVVNGRRWRTGTIDARSSIVVHRLLDRDEVRAHGWRVAVYFGDGETLQEFFRGNEAQAVQPPAVREAMVPPSDQRWFSVFTVLWGTVMGLFN